MTIDLDNMAAETWAYTLTLFAASANTTPALKVICRSCQSTLGYAGTTSIGPLFTSSWKVDLVLPFSIQVGRRVLNRGEAVRWDKAERERTLETTSGRPIDWTGLDCLIAPLAIPPDLPQTYPPLYVRCAKHGDAVLDRGVVIDALRRKVPVLKVPVSLPLRPVALQRHDDLPGKVTHSSETRRETWRHADTP